MEGIRPHILSRDPNQLEREFVERGWDGYRAAQVLRWVYRGVLDPARMGNIPKYLRDGLGETYELALPPVAREVASDRDGSTKLALRLGDGRILECVHLRTPRLHTLCVSSQVGCALACTFCATGRMGLLRNLQPWEILAQILTLRLRTPPERHVNVVFMGMGEPMANYERVLQAVRMANHEETLAVGARHFTVSTSGLVPGIRRLAGEQLQVGLAVSLNAPTDEQRSQIMPVNRRYPLGELLKAVRFYVETSRRHVTFEYVLLGGFNDSAADARRLSRLTRDLPHKLNLINWNPTPDASFRPSPRVDAFRDLLLAEGHRVTLRYSQGRDVNAACGQLGADLLARA
ncbi:MAG TPA: 23S rRNA (adenine(2503)-C(2))-methyltransferase RlmN [Candidatus Saccharimonadales bacterium]|nr:23S rRNA (adenine(2503)-C(2))-methyltransferase RlmN [Candidatus Saccharimonadales bacterium]